MAKSIIQSFSLDITEASILAQAEDKAKEQGKSFSKYIVNLMKEDLEREKKEIAHMPILNKDYQTSIFEYIPKIYKDNVERDKLFQYIRTCDNEKLTALSIQVNAARKEIDRRRGTHKFTF